MLPSKEIEDFALRDLNALLVKYDSLSKAKMQIRPLDALLAKYDFLSVAAAPRFIYLLSPVNKNTKPRNFHLIRW